MINVKNITASANLQDAGIGDILYLVSTSSGAVSLTLSGASKVAGQQYVFKHVSGVFAFTISPQLGETVAGGSSWTSSGVGDVLNLVSDGSNWISLNGIVATGGVENPMTENLDAGGYDITGVDSLAADDVDALLVKTTSLQIRDGAEPTRLVSLGTDVLDASYPFNFPNAVPTGDQFMVIDSNGLNAWKIYDEGTWTPAVTLVGGSGNAVPVYTTNSGNYTRIGNLVICSIFLEGDGGTEGAGTGVIYISLPTAASAVNSGWYYPAGWLQNGSASYSVLGAVGGSNVSLAYMSSTTVTDLTGAQQNNTTRRINLVFAYFV